LSVAINEMSVAVRRKAFETCRPLVLAAGKRLVIPLFHRAGLEIVKSKDLTALYYEINKNVETIIEYLKEIDGYKREIEGYKHEIEGYRHEIEGRRKSIEELRSFIADYQLKLEHSYDYQMIAAQDQVRSGMSNLEPEFLAEYERCRQYSTTSWERLYALYTIHSPPSQHP